MIVRLMGEGQYEVPDEVVERLQALDEQAISALDQNDEAELDAVLEQMAVLVRAEGTSLPEDTLEGSELVIPPSDLTLEETRKLFSEDGLIPDLPV